MGRRRSVSTRLGPVLRVHRRGIERRRARQKLARTKRPPTGDRHPKSALYGRRTSGPADTDGRVRLRADIDGYRSICTQPAPTTGTHYAMVTETLTLTANQLDAWAS